MLITNVPNITFVPEELATFHQRILHYFLWFNYRLLIGVESHQHVSHIFKSNGFCYTVVDATLPSQTKQKKLLYFDNLGK